MPNFQYGDIVLLDYPFAERRISKRRPALVLIEDAENDILVFRITSKSYTGTTDVPIRDWTDAGLNAKSIVRLTKMVTVGEMDVIKKVGTLTAYDKTVVGGVLKGFIDDAVSATRE
jgi:mRNA interferase MazF